MYQLSSVQKKKHVSVEGKWKVQKGKDGPLKV